MPSNQNLIVEDPDPVTGQPHPQSAIVEDPDPGIVEDPDPSVTATIEEQPQGANPYVDTKGSRYSETGGSGGPIFMEPKVEDSPAWREHHREAEAEDAKWKARGHGFRKYGAWNFDDEIGGLVQGYMQLGPALRPKFIQDWADEYIGKDNELLNNRGARDENGNIIPPLDVYRDGRDGNRMEERNIESANPDEYLQGALASAVIPTPVNPAIVGAVNGLGANEDDLTRPTIQGYDGAAKDAILGGIAGELVGRGAKYVGNSVNSLPLVQNGIAQFNRISNHFGQKADEALLALANRAEKNISSRYAQMTGAEGPAQAEMGRAVEFIRDNLPTVQTLFGKQAPSVMGGVANNEKEFLEQQALKKLETMANWEPPRNIKVPDVDDGVREIGRLADADVAKGKSNAGKALLNMTYNLPLGIGQFVRSGVRAVRTAGKVLGSDGVTMKLNRWAQRKLAADPSSLGNYAQHFINGEIPVMTDYVLSQTDAGWRELKKKFEEETAGEEDGSE